MKHTINSVQCQIISREIRDSLMAIDLLSGTIVQHLGYIDYYDDEVTYTLWGVKCPTKFLNVDTAFIHLALTLERKLKG